MGQPGEQDPGTDGQATASQVADGVHRLSDGYVNSYVIVDGSALTVVDTGLPGHSSRLRALVAGLGHRPSDVEAIILTHAHVDHIGGVRRLRADSGAPLRVHTDDADPGLRRFPPPWLYLRPSAWPWLVQGVKERLVLAPALHGAVPFADGDALDVPGSPRVLHTPGHTPGHCAVHLADRGVLLSGDALVTFDPYTRRRGPRLLLPGVNDDDAQAHRSMLRLGEVHADVILPGHGDPWHGDPQAAVSEALAAQR